MSKEFQILLSCSSSIHENQDGSYHEGTESNDSGTRPEVSKGTETRTKQHSQRVCPPDPAETRIRIPCTEELCLRKSVVLDGKRTVVVIGQPRKRTRKREKTYDKAVIDALQRLRAFSNGLFGKLLAVFIRQTLPVLEKWGDLTLAEPVRAKVMAISPASIDRLLASTKKQSALKGRTHTKPGTLLKHHLPIRTFSDWNESEPGFVEIDLVAHDGGIANGDYAQTLDVTDIATTWTETRVV